jgi:hypothetical protein
MLSNPASLWSLLQMFGPTAAPRAGRGCPSLPLSWRPFRRSQPSGPRIALEISVET